MIRECLDAEGLAPEVKASVLEAAKVLEGQGATLRLVQLGKAQLEVAQRNVPARTRQPP
jgi:ribosomal protein L30E